MARHYIVCSQKLAAIVAFAENAGFKSHPVMMVRYPGIIADLSILQIVPSKWHMDKGTGEGMLYCGDADFPDEIFISWSGHFELKGLINWIEGSDKLSQLVCPNPNATRDAILQRLKCFPSRNHSQNHLPANYSTITFVNPQSLITLPIALKCHHNVEWP
ncbi:hypothetical protein TNCT_641781 [Trichonephila clavata]|uniref:Uncharacterized protein n=1 Tax=Trichonephila clavata TaxID=2740835 RepID=A0A8X6H413_TRICU|nr:hypothetical protein TNCT_641781 [Trichonephila clavata]